MYQEKDVNDQVDEILEKISAQVQSELSIVVGGKVSSGKSSFLNALFSCKQSTPIFKVGAQAGVTTEPKDTKLGDNVVVWDTPGLNDLNGKNVETTLKFLKKGHDLAILVLSGAADASQKENYDVLKSSVPDGHLIVVLNKVDGESKANREILVNQWKNELGLSHSDEIFCCVSKGYGKEDRIVDQFTGEEIPIPTDEFGIPRTLQGIDEVTQEVSKKLEQIDKDLLFLKSQQNKNKAALATISTACVAAGGFALVPGSGATITATQIGAICALHLIYTGEILSKTQALAILPAYASQAIGTNIFLWAKSVLPPTGVVDAAASCIAVTITAAMLVTVNYMLKNDISLDDKTTTKQMYGEFKGEFTDIIKNSSFKDWTSTEFWKQMILKFI